MCIHLHYFSFRGDYRSGKRLNMRRIVPYIASNFQNDRIWLRRTKPSQREYQVLLAIDDSSSMHENQCKEVCYITHKSTYILPLANTYQMAYESLALISSALSKLDCGELGVCRLDHSNTFIVQDICSNAGLVRMLKYFILWRNHFLLQVVDSFCSV